MEGHPFDRSTTVTIGEFVERDARLHPPAFTPGYKTTVLRSPRQALLSPRNTLSEITGPVFNGKDLGER